MPKGLPWFRLYSEFAFDPKIQTTSETLQRRFVMLLCLKCNGDIPGLNDIQLSCALRISIEELHKTQKELVSIGVITENYDIPQWDKRQYRSDSSTERVKKYRSKNNGTLQKRYRNGNVTALSVSVSESKSVSDSFNIFWKSYPKKIGKGAAKKSFDKIKPNGTLLDQMIKTIEWQKNTKDWTKDRGQYIPHPVTWLNQERWNDEKPDEPEYLVDFQGIRYQNPNYKGIKS